MDSHRRTIAKALSWRLVATTVTSTLVFLATGEAQFAATVALADTGLKLFLYGAHERAWNRIPYGRRREAEYYILRERTSGS